MVITCNRCAKTFTCKSNLRRHQNESCKGSPEAFPLVGDDTVNAVDIELAPTAVKRRKVHTSIGHGIEGENPIEKDRAEEVESKIRDTVEYLIRHDRTEIDKLLTAFQDGDNSMRMMFFVYVNL